MRDSTNAPMYALEIAGEPVLLSALRALYLPNRSALVVADLHWGKAATFRAKGVPLPSGTTADDLERLTRVVRDTGAERLVIVGDLFHAKMGRHERTLDTIALWRRAHAALDMVLIRGNHDAHAGDPPAEWGIQCVDAPWTLGPFACQHHPAEHPSQYVLAGHLHPHVQLRGRARERAHLPCFVFGERVAVLPAFTGFTGHGAFTPSSGDRLYVIADGQVIPTQ